MSESILPLCTGTVSCMAQIIRTLPLLSSVISTRILHACPKGRGD